MTAGQFRFVKLPALGQGELAGLEKERLDKIMRASNLALFLAAEIPYFTASMFSTWMVFVGLS